MFRVAVDLFFITICIHGLHSSAEDLDLHPVAASPGKDNATSVETKVHHDKNHSTEAPKTTTEASTTLPKPDDVTTSATVKEQNATKAPSTESSEQRSKKATRSINNHTTDRPTMTTATTTGSQPNVLHVIEIEPNIDDIVEGILDKPNLKFRNDDLEYNLTRAGPTTTKRPEPGYLGKLTGSLIVPTLKARQTLTKAFTKQNEGLKNFGSGTYEAAAGAFNFVKDATAAVIKG